MQKTALLLLALSALSGCAGGAAQQQEPARPEPLAGTAPATTTTPGCKSGYPAESRQRGEKGTVVLRVFVETSGQATKSEVYRSSGFARLDQAALDYAGCLRFKPPLRNGVPVAMWFQVPVNYGAEKAD